MACGTEGALIALGATLCTTFASKVPAMQAPPFCGGNLAHMTCGFWHDCGCKWGDRDAHNTGSLTGDGKGTATNGGTYCCRRHRSSSPINDGTVWPHLSRLSVPVTGFNATLSVVVPSNWGSRFGDLDFHIAVVNG